MRFRLPDNLSLVFRRVHICGCALGGECSDSPKDVRYRLHSFTSKPVDWRWETMEDAARDEIGMFSDYKANYSEEVLKRDSALNSAVKEGLFDEIHLCISHVLFVICAAAGTNVQNFRP